MNLALFILLHVNHGISRKKHTLNLQHAPSIVRIEHLVLLFLRERNKPFLADASLNASALELEAIAVPISSMVLFMSGGRVKRHTAA